MYEFYSKEKLKKRYPIIETKADAIILFTSCDGNNGYKLASVIGHIYPEIKYAYENFCFNGQIEKGKILMQNKVTPIIINIPFKEEFMDEPSLEYLRSGFEKLESYCKKNGNLKSIAIQKNIIEDNILKEAIINLDLPEIIYYEDVSNNY